MRIYSAEHVNLAGAVMLALFTSWVGDTGAGDPHAPCFNCEIYNLMQHDQSFHDRQIDSQCQYPCKCANKELRCKAGVNVVKDGCDCCYMCARQQGDLCDYKDKCDEEKGLYCDFRVDGGRRGICRAKEAKPCIIEGKTYKDGEEFKPDCRRLCSCQNGQYACTTLCPQEETRPSRKHCKDSRLVAITGKCCKEWTCPVQQDMGYPSEQGASTYAPRPISAECKKETTPWSSCSVTCGMGVSIRVTNDNEDCQPVQQRRLCLVRPCELNDKHLTGKSCRSTWKAKGVRLTNGDCASIQTYKFKYCSSCKRRKCCGPGRTKTITVEFKCEDGRTTMEPFMFIKNCECHKERRCPWR